MDRFEDTPGLFGAGVGIGTFGDIKCGICGSKYNQGNDENESYNGESVRYTDFAGITVCECCFGEVEREVLNRIMNIIPWYTRILKSKDNELEERRKQILDLICEPVPDNANNGIGRYIDL